MTTEKNIIVPDRQLITIEKGIYDIMATLGKRGHKALLIGGAVRDALLGLEPKDIDIEVYNISYSDLNDFLSAYGMTDLVGKTFGVIKFRPHLYGVGASFDPDYHVYGKQYDFSVPRRENKIGIGHKAFEMTFDSTMTIEESGRRRDFSWNAIAYDPIENKIYDYFGGLDDLKNKIIRHTSDAFKEDALRVLRCLQFQARFDFTIHPDTIKMMQEILKTDDFNNLSKERIFEEFKKWAEKGVRHDLIFQFMRDTGLIEYYPELKALKETMQDKIWHPEGNVETHTCICLSAMDKIIEQNKISGEEKLILVMAILLHDIAKPNCSEEQMKNGRMAITSHGHEALGADMAKEFLSRLGFHADLVHPICNLIADHLAGVSISSIDERKGRLKAVKRLSRRLNPATIQQLIHVMNADHNGRGSDTWAEATGGKELLELAEEVKVKDKPYQYILMGRHLIEAGLPPSPEFGNILRAASVAQEDGLFNDLDGAKSWLTGYMNEEKINAQ